jgi:hypothetical protein
MGLVGAGEKRVYWHQVLFSAKRGWAKKNRRWKDRERAQQTNGVPCVKPERLWYIAVWRGTANRKHGLAAKASLFFGGLDLFIFVKPGGFTIGRNCITK